MTVNCWEVKECGKEPGGKNAESSGVCPAAVESRLDGKNHGRNAGRSCWVVAGTMCEGVVQGAFATKLVSCSKCEFFRQVAREERPDAVSTVDLLSLLDRR